MTHKKNQHKTNGQAGPHDRVNGHASASTEWGGIPVQRDHAASDDTGRASLAMDASSTNAPGTDCEAYAEVAPPPPIGHLHDVTNEPSEHGDQAEPIPGGESPLPADAGEFVEEIHRRADLFIVWQELLNSKDDKIKQRAVERPAFFSKYVASLYTNNKIAATEAYARGFSWGLMQVMGQVARETGFDVLFLSALCDPEQGLAVGCKVLRKKLDAMAGDTTRALLAWNGGANPAYAAQVLARRARYL